MKTNTTDDQIKAIKLALDKMHIRPFRAESSNPKWNAQKNLNGKTHYVDDDTLRFHKSRVLSCRELHGGLLLRIVCSDSMDTHNTRRGFRAAVFDVFGTCIHRPKLEDALCSKKAAINVSDREEIDLVEHYRKALNRKVEEHNREIAELNESIAMLPPAPIVA